MDEKIVFFEIYWCVFEGFVYCMFGIFVDVQDVVQEMYLKWCDVDFFIVCEFCVWFVMVCSCFVINVMKFVCFCCEIYVGIWFFEFLIDEFVFSFVDQIQIDEMVFVVLMFFLEKFFLLECVVFLLYEVFDYGFDEIVMIFGKISVVCCKFVLCVCLNLKVEWL